MTNLTIQQSKSNQKIKDYASLAMGIIGIIVIIAILRLIYVRYHSELPIPLIADNMFVSLWGVIIVALLVPVSGLILGLKSAKSNIAKAGIIISGIGVAIIMIIVIVIFIIIAALSVHALSVHIH